MLSELFCRSKMIFRSLSVCRPLLKYVAANSGPARSAQPIRKSHVVSYRVGPTSHSKATMFGAEAVSAFMWWWILWHLWHEHEHITGEFPYPKASSWTNEELGIPSDR